jgi:SAM-dependent methyltransferase
VRPAVRDELLRINRAFYQSLAEPFAATRPRPQPGVGRVLGRVDPAATVLDVGCGHGVAAGRLLELGFHGRYLGIDSSAPLIELARRRVAASWATFVEADLAVEEGLPAEAAHDCDWILAFAFLHHIPDGELRRRVVASLRNALRPGGSVAVSVWSFGEVERFRRKQVAWDEVGVRAEDVEPGDVLLDWRAGGRGVRYVHRFTSGELEDLARSVELSVVEEFHSDGEGGRMGLYQVWGLS